MPGEEERSADSNRLKLLRSMEPKYPRKDHCKSQEFGQCTKSILGTVEKGKIADLVLLEANPLEDINNTQKIAGVVIRGELISKSELQAMLGKPGVRWAH